MTYDDEPQKDDRDDLDEYPGNRPCPVCRGTEWREDYVGVDENEIRIETCARCGWPPPGFTSPEKYGALYESLGREPNWGELRAAYAEGRL